MAKLYALMFLALVIAFFCGDKMLSHRRKIQGVSGGYTIQKKYIIELRALNLFSCTSIAALYRI